MRARLFGRWVGRAAVFAVLGLGALVAGGVASASADSSSTEIPSVGSAASSAVAESGFAALGVDWN